MFDKWIERHLLDMRAQPRQKRTVIGPAGTFRPLEDGERVILGPGGAKIRVVERIGDKGSVSGNQIETNEQLHAVVRPASLALRLGVHE